MSTPFPGPMHGLTIITEEGDEHSIMGTALHPVFLDGTGMAPIRRIMEKAPFQMGMSDRGFRLEPRRMTLQLYLEGKDMYHADGLRDRVAHLFLGTNSPLKLRVSRDDLNVRQIDCYVDGTVDFPQSTRVGAAQPVSIPLVAPDPTWYYPTQQVSTMALTNGGNSLSLTISGMTADDWPVIDITGPLSANFNLLHQPGTHNIVFDQAIPGGETFRVDLRPGYKTVRRTSDNANRLSYVDPDTLGVFSEMRVMSQKATQATNAGYTTTNTFGGTAAGTSGASALTVYWYRRYASL